MRCCHMITRVLHAVAVLVASATAVTAAAQISELVPPEAKIAGVSQNEWGDRWWQWAFSFDATESPVRDTVGTNCHLNQTGSVWFLAGTYSRTRTIRTCTVPTGKYIFFPLVNYVYYPQGRSSNLRCEALMENAAELSDDVRLLVLELNGVRARNLEQHRFASTACFNIGARRVPTASIFPAAANGYFAMLKPLPPGKYELNFGGILASNSQAVTYHLIVK